MMDTILSAKTNLRKMYGPQFQQRSREAPQPSVLIISVPKSGTVFLHNSLADILGLQSMTISNQNFPEDQIRLDEIIEFASGKKIASAHLDPSMVNIQFLDEYVPRWIVHLRDPRSVILSWTHHLNRLWQEGRKEKLLHVTPCPRPSYMELTFADQVYWQINNFLPSVISWMNSWIALADTEPERILVTEYGQMAGREASFIAKISNFLRMPFNLETYQPIKKTMENAHFRTGTKDEWQTSFTVDQIEKINGQIPIVLAKRFGWDLT